MNTVEMPAERQRRGPGRPSKEAPMNREVDEAAAKLVAKNALPQPPAKEINFDQMVEYFALLTPEMWSHVVIYVYRIKPRIIRQLKDPALPKYIDCLSQPITMEYMTHHHGGGKYLFEVVDSAPHHKRTESNHLFRCKLEIDEVRHEPKLNYEELDINNRENMSYIQLLQHRGILDGKGQIMQNTNQPNGSSGLNADVIKEILGFVSKLNADQQTALRARLSTDEDGLSKGVGQILLEKMKQDDPAKQVSMLSGLLVALKDIVGTQKPTDNTSVFDRLITMQADHNKTILQLMKESRTPAASEGTPHNFLDDIDKLMNAVDRLQGLRGGNGNGSRSGWDVGLDYVKELGLPMMQTISNFFAIRNGQPIAPVTAAPGAGPAPRAAFDPYRDQSALRAHAAAINGPPQPAAPPAPGPGNELMGVMQAYGNLVVNALNNGTPGYDFADYVCGLMGTGTHAMLSAQGEQALVATGMQIPELAMFGEARLRTFCNEFIHYEKFLQDAESPEVMETK